MTTTNYGVTAYSIQSAKQTTKYGELTPLPVSSSARVLFRADLSRIPVNAVISSAKLRFWNAAAHSGSVSLTVSQITSSWTSSVTWKTAPTFASTPTATASSSATNGALVEFDVSTIVAQIVAGATANRGFCLRSSSSTVVKLAGTKAAKNTPVLVVTYTVPPTAPANLHPSDGLVSASRPLLTWDAPADMTAFQLQISTDPTFASGVWSSGTVAGSGGLFDLSTSDYPGLSAGTTTYWRVQQTNAAGWSPWSGAAEFELDENLPTISITAPTGSTVADGSPTFAWSLSSGTQIAYQARWLDGVTGKVYADSGYVPSSDGEWAADKGLSADGQTGILELMVWDDSLRVATASAPDYIFATYTFTLSAATDGPLDGLTATSDGVRPYVTLAGHRSEIPDEVVITRNGKQIARIPGTDCFDGSGNFTYVDAPPMGVEADYSVRPVTDGTWRGAVTASITPYAAGIWLLDASDMTQAVPIWGDDSAAEQDYPEISVVHTPVTDSSDGLSAQVVRRRLIRYQVQGSIDGTIADGLGVEVSAAEALLRKWTEYDAGHKFRLLLGNLSTDVIVGDLVLTERSDSGPTNGRLVDVAFSYWGQED